MTSKKLLIFAALILVLSIIAPRYVFADDYGDDCSEAHQVNIGTKTSGTIEVPGDVDVFRFTATQSGKYVMYTRGNTDTTGYLFDSNCNQLTLDYSNGEGENFCMIYSLNTGATYYVAVKGASSSSTTGNYDFFLEGPGAGVSPEESDAFSPWSARTVNVGTKTSGRLDVEGDRDYFKFTATQSGKYVMYTRAHNGEYTDTTGYLFDSDYNQLTLDYSNGEVENFCMIYSLNAGATYYVQVSGPSSTPGNYDFFLEGPGAGVNSEESDAFSPWSAIPVDIGSITPGTLDAEGDRDYFRFSVCITGTYVMYTTGYTDTTGYLFDSDYNQLTLDYSNGEGENFKITYSLNAGATYYVQVSGTYSMNGYNFHLEGPSPILSVTPSSRDLSSCSGTTTFNVSNTGSGTMTWSASVISGSDWLSITSGSSGTNSGTINISNTQNTTASSRTGTIRVTASCASPTSKDITITQEGAAILSIAPSSRNVDSSSGTTTFSVSNTGSGTMNWSASVTSGTSWLSITDGNSGLGGGTTTVSFSQNNTGSSRTGTIRFTAPCASGSPTDVTVTQVSAPVPVLSVTPSTQNVGYSSDTTSFTVSNTGSGTMTWSASVISGSDWLSITSGSNGTNSGTITAFYSQNTTSSSRTGTIRVTASGATGSPTDVTVTQSFTPGSCDGPTITVGTASTCASGSQIEVPITINDIAEETSCNFSVSFDNTKLQYMGYTNGDIATLIAPYAWDVNARGDFDPIVFFETGATSGTICKVKFTLLANISQGSQLNLTIGEINSNVNYCGKSGAVICGSGGCNTWADVITKYNEYVSGAATWSDVITCYNQYASQ